MYTTSKHQPTTNRAVDGFSAPHRTAMKVPRRYGHAATKKINTPPHAFDPHQCHRPVTSWQIAHPGGTPIMQPGNRPTHRAPAGRCGRLDGVLQFTVTLGNRQHGHAFQRPSITVALLLSFTWGPSCSCSVTPRIMRPQAHSQGQADSRVTRALPRFITKSLFDT
jgi:hypothetical protein